MYVKEVTVENQVGLHARIPVVLGILRWVFL